MVGLPMWIFWGLSFWAPSDAERRRIPWARFVLSHLPFSPSPMSLLSTSASLWSPQNSSGVRFSVCETGWQTLFWRCLKRKNVLQQIHHRDTENAEKYLRFTTETQRAQRKTRNIFHQKDTKKTHSGRNKIRRFRRFHRFLFTTEGTEDYKKL
jgi:hypothetical protein